MEEKELHAIGTCRLCDEERKLALLDDAVKALEHQRSKAHSYDPTSCPDCDETRRVLTRAAALGIGGKK